MSDRGADQSEMRRPSNLSDREIDELFNGDAPVADDSLEDLAELLSLARSDLSATPDEAIEARHLTAIVDAAQLAANGSPAWNAADRASEPDQRVAFTWRRKPVLKNRKLSSLAAALGLAGGVVVVGFGGSAYAGVLPDPVQGVVADVGDSIGLSLPGADEDNGDDGHLDNVVNVKHGNVDGDQPNNVDDSVQDDVDADVDSPDSPDSADDDADLPDASDSSDSSDSSDDANDDAADDSTDADGTDDSSEDVDDDGGTDDSSEDVDDGTDDSSDGDASDDGSSGHDES